MNNKGFAITSVIYGLMILFILLVSSFLAVLVNRNNRMNKLVDDIYTSVEVPKINVASSNFTSDPLRYVTSKRGLYSFNNINGVNCTVYLPKSTVVAINESNELVYSLGGGEDINTYSKLSLQCIN